MENNEQQPDNNPPAGPVHSPRTWRACCLAPVLALGVLLILTVGASLFSPGTKIRDYNPLPKQKAGDPVKRQSFIQFGKDFFAIAKKADTPSEEAFKAMQAYTQKKGSLDDVHSTFKKAAEANGNASSEFKNLAVPDNLTSRDKLQKSINNISDSYDYRRQACEVMTLWNGDTKDKETSDKFISLTQKINTLTRSSLRNMMEAAGDNGLTADDVKEFAPASSVSSSDLIGSIKEWSIEMK